MKYFTRFLTVWLLLGWATVIYAAPLAYVTNEVDGTISVIDVATDTAIDTFPVAAGGGTSGIQVLASTPDGSRLYIADAAGDEVIVVDVATRTVIDRVSISGTPNNVAVSPDGSKVYTTLFSGDSVAVIDTATNTLTSTIGPNPIPVDDQPQGVTVTPDGTSVYVAHGYQQGGIANARVLVIDTTTDMIVDQVDLPSFSRSQQVAITPDGATGYVVIQDSDAVGVFDTVNNTYTTTIFGFNSPAPITISPDGSTAYVSNIGVVGNLGTTVSVIDTAPTNAIRSTISGFNTFPIGQAISAAGTKLYVAEHQSDTAAVVDTAINTITARIPVGDFPRDVEIPSSLSVEIDIKPGGDPNCFNIDGHGIISVAILGSNEFNVNEIDTNTVSFAGLEVRVRGNNNPQCSTEEINGNSFLDLVCQFEDNPKNWNPGDGIAELTGELMNGTPFKGTDSICIVP